MVSPDQKYIAFGDELYLLNRSNGTINLVLKLEAKELEFSPNGQLLYGIIGTKLYQFDLRSSDIMKSKTLIATHPLNILALAPDGKIYNFSQRATLLQYSISCPNEQGQNCSFQENGIDLKGRITNNGFTNICSHYLYKDGIICNEPPTDPSFLDSSSTNMHCSLYVEYLDFEDKIYLKFINNWKSNYSLQVFDLSGRMLHSYNQIGTDMIELSSTDYVHGLYLVKLVIDDTFSCMNKIVFIK